MLKKIRAIFRLIGKGKEVKGIRERLKKKSNAIELN